MKNFSYIFYLIITVAVIVLYYLHFRGINYNRQSQVLNDFSNSSNIVFVNTDSIWAKYKFVNDKKKELEEYEEKLQQNYNARLKALEKEYNDYLKEGSSGKLTLAQQKKKEEELGNKQQELSEYDRKLSAQFMELQQKLNYQIQDSIVNYIKRNVKKNKFIYVLGYSRSSGILYADDKLDITKEIVNGLNEEYGK